MPTGNITEYHPYFSAYIELWHRLRVLAAGSRAVKESGDEFLPPLASHRFDGYPTANSDGFKNYETYKTRAHFYGYFSKAIRRAIGIMHRKPPEIELPPGLDFLRDRATPTGEPLTMLLRNINREQLLSGRVGLLVDSPEGPSITSTPYIALYHAEKIRNWQDGSSQPGRDTMLRFVVLDESGPVASLENLGWVNQEKYRVLALVAPGGGSAMRYGVQVVSSSTGRNNDSEDESASTLFSFDEGGLVFPKLRNSEADFIPFTFINSEDIVSRPSQPPFAELAEIDITLYQSDADYRRTLSMQGEETLVTKGQIKGDEGTEGEADLRVGAGARLHLLDLEGDAKYIGISAGGLEQQAAAIKDLIQRAEHESMALIESRMAEAADTVNQRMAGKTFSLKDVAHAGAAGLEQSIKQLAIWYGQDPSRVSVNPNLDFEADELSAGDLLSLAQAKALGTLRLSHESIHQKLVQHEWTTKTFEEEGDALDAELDDEDNPEGTEAGGDPEPDLETTE